MKPTKPARLDKLANQDNSRPGAAREGEQKCDCHLFETQCCDICQGVDGTEVDAAPINWQAHAEALAEALREAAGALHNVCAVSHMCDGCMSYETASDALNSNHGFEQALAAYEAAAAQAVVPDGWKLVPVAYITPEGLNALRCDDAGPYSECEARISSRPASGAIPLYAAPAPEASPSFDERDALQDMLADARYTLELVRVALGVAVEPHQSLAERLVEAAESIPHLEADAARYRWLREHDARGLWDFKGAYHDIAVLKRGADLDAAIDDAVSAGTRRAIVRAAVEIGRTME